jgi:hypothetical protein
MYIIYKCGIGGNSISKRALFWASTEIVEGLGGLESKSDTVLKLENKITALEGRLRESENMCSAQKVQIADLLGVWVNQTEVSLRQRIGYGSIFSI